MCVECKQVFKTIGSFQSCFPCNQKKKQDACTGCEMLFDGKGRYTLCFRCSAATKSDRCDGCKRPFDGKGKYTRCYTCSKNGAPAAADDGYETSDTEDVAPPKKTPFW
jgi:hypothetical protein